MVKFLKIIFNIIYCFNYKFKYKPSMELKLHGFENYQASGKLIEIEMWNSGKWKVKQYFNPHGMCHTKSEFRKSEKTIRVLKKWLIKVCEGVTGSSNKKFHGLIS